LVWHSKLTVLGKAPTLVASWAEKGTFRGGALAKKRPVFDKIRNAERPWLGKNVDRKRFVVEHVGK